MSSTLLILILALAAVPLAAQQAGVGCAASRSTPTLCAEQDNVNIPLRGGAKSFTVEATHPGYSVGADNCAADFINCPTASDPGYPFTPGVTKLFDDGDTVVEAVRDASWWRPNAMAVSVDSGAATQSHYIRLYKKIAGENSWPQFLVLYQDGNMRLIPQPPAGAGQVCFGASVLIGPAQPADRPLAEISSIKYLTATRSLQIAYLAGGSATIAIQEVSRQVSRVAVSVNFPAANAAFSTLRSMYVATANSDTDSVRWIDVAGAAHEDSVMTFAGGPAAEWFFYRRVRSQHNTSAPDIRIRVTSALPMVYADGVVNAASMTGAAIAPGEFVSILGCGLGPGTGVAAQPVGRVLGSALAGARALFDGVAAPLWYAASGQLNALVPYSVGTKATTQLQVEYNGQRSDTVPLPVSDAAPGIFTMRSSGTGQAAALNQDWTPNATANPARRGSVVMFYATGEGQTDPAGVDGSAGIDPPLPKPRLPVSVQIGGVPAVVAYAATAPGYPGLLQVYATVPDTAPAGTAPLLLTIGTRTSQAGVTIALK